jgi:hypothetical protein
MPDEVTIPCLPCISLEATFPFYELLGFEVTYRQKSPNVYGVIRRGGCELHFYGLKGLVPEAAFSTCLVIVPDVEGLHREFAGALRQGLGKVPVRGLPRLSRMKPGQTRFTVTDPAGNSVIFIKRGDEDQAASQAYLRAGQTRLGRALSLAARLRDFKLDDAAAAKVLDAALARETDAPPSERASALVVRAELALALGDERRAFALRAEVATLPLPDEDLRRHLEELQAAGLGDAAS